MIGQCYSLKGLLADNTDETRATRKSESSADAYGVACEQICRASRLPPGDEDAVSGLFIRMARIMMLETESREAK